MILVKWCYPTYNLGVIQIVDVFEIEQLKTQGNAIAQKYHSSNETIFNTLHNMLPLFVGPSMMAYWAFSTRILVTVVN